MAYFTTGVYHYFYKTVFAVEPQVKFSTTTYVTIIYTAQFILSACFDLLHLLHCRKNYVCTSLKFKYVQ